MTSGPPGDRRERAARPPSDFAVTTRSDTPACSIPSGAGAPEPGLDLVGDETIPFAARRTEAPR